MKKIRISRLKLENFKCHKLLDLDLSGSSASIYGDNATGKTSIYDAFTWLLFGKDSRGTGEKNLDLKPLGPDGQVADHEAITAVEATLTVDGAPVTLRRELKENWVSRRGSSKEEFAGNASTYYIDGVPVKKYAYDGRVAEIVDEDAFRMLTMVNYFPETMHWQDRRAILFAAIGNKTDTQIMDEAGDRFANLLAAMDGRQLDDLKKILASRKKSLTGVKNDLPGRIAEVTNIAQQYDQEEDAAEALEEVRARRKALEAQLAAAGNGSYLAERESALNAAQSSLRALEAENQAHRQRQGGGPEAVKRLRNAIVLAEDKVRRAGLQLSRLAKEKQSLEDGISACRAEWDRWNNLPFTAGTCAYCGQSLAGTALERAEAAHRQRVADGKTNAITAADNAKRRLAGVEDAIAEVEETQRLAAKEKAEMETELIRANQAEDLPGYREKRQALEAEADQISQQVATLRRDSAEATANLRQSIREVDREIQAGETAIARKNMVPELLERAEDLRQQLANSARQLEEVEGLLFQAEEFCRYKAQLLEDDVNHLFQMASFRLFRQQANGGVEERCDVTYQGIPYGSLNNGARINVGMDIIHTLSKVYGVSVPLFVDNAESVTRLADYGGQVIRLVVSEADKEVRVNAY